MTKKELKMVPKGEAAVIEQFNPKKQNIDLIRSGTEYDIATDGFKNVTISHLDIKGYQLNGPYIVIQTHDDTQYVYRAEQFDLMKLYVTE